MPDEAVRAVFYLYQMKESVNTQSYRQNYTSSSDI